ncbi:putative RNA 2'-O-ribose methyltransferase [Citrobacter koseri]|uniref:Putative RNA 2'-O-ribose methyltransferase n=1 Tax=Citrobacter koseri TaxID=545 RepID=A0A447UK21_CITKO|nr:putative RNA 2'-O-ribose methyltransferase [Citrobacter koseri]
MFLFRRMSGHERLANGMYAVDLGACPGGWTYQLVKRNMWVYSVDNGPNGAEPDGYRAGDLAARRWIQIPSEP